MFDLTKNSQMLGKTTIQIQNHSYNQGGKEGSGRNISINQQERALMLPQELKQMGATTSIIVLEDCPPIKAQKIRYYESEFFKSRLLEKVKICEGFMNQYQKTNLLKKAMCFHAIFLRQRVGRLGVGMASVQEQPPIKKSKFSQKIKV